MIEINDDETASRIYTEIDNATGDERMQMADALGKYGEKKLQEEYNTNDEHYSKMFMDDAYNQEYKGRSTAIKEAVNPDETWQRGTIQGYLSHRLGRDVTADNYEIERDAFSMSAFGQKNINDGQLFDFISGDYETQQKKTEALNDLHMQSVGKAINDSQLGQNRPFVDGMTDVFNTWQQKYPELVDGTNDAAFLSQGYKLYYDTINDLDSVRPQAAQTLTTLEKFTKGEADPEALQTLSNTLIGASPEERQKIYKYVTLAAEAGHIDRAGLDQFALNMGQSFTRGFDFVPQGSLQMQEAGVNNWLESIRNGTQIWVPVDGDLSKAEVGNAPAGVESDAWRQATVPEAETLIQSGQNVREGFKVVRELRNVAKTGVDPIRPVLEEKSFWGTAERGAYGLAGSIPLMGATAVNPFLGVIAYQANEYDRIMLENPDVNPQFAQGLALVEGAANAAIDRVQLKSLSGKLPMFGRYLDRIKNDGIRRTVKIGANVVEQNLQEGAQDLIAPVLETAVAALREDMPDKDFTSLMDEWAGQRAETFFATLPLALIGGGVATYQDIKNPSAELNATRLRQVGFDKEQTTFIQRAENPEEYDARIQMEWDKRTPEAIEAGRQEVIAEMQQAATPDENSAKLSETVAEDDTRRWVVTTPDGKELLQTQDQQAALDAIAQHGHAQILNKQFETQYEPEELRQIITDLSTKWTSEKPVNTLSMESEGMNAQQELEQLQAAGNAAQIQELHNRIANSPLKDTPYEQINITGKASVDNILGKASVDDVAEMVFGSLITINPNTRPENLREEIHHIGVKVALKNGSVTLDTLRGWLDATEKALPGTFQNLVRDSEGDIVESLSQVQAAYENGKINADEETKLPPSFIGYIKNMMRTFAEVMRRAVALRGAFKDGALPAEYESFLADSVGLNQQSRVDTASSRVANELTQGLFNYSIGSMPEDQRAAETSGQPSRGGLNAEESFGRPSEEFVESDVKKTYWNINSEAGSLSLYKETPWDEDSNSITGESKYSVFYAELESDRQDEYRFSNPADAKEKIDSILREETQAAEYGKWVESTIDSFRGTFDFKKSKFFTSAEVKPIGWSSKSSSRYFSVNLDIKPEIAETFDSKNIGDYEDGTLNLRVRFADHAEKSGPSNDISIETRDYHSQQFSRQDSKTAESQMASAIADGALWKKIAEIYNDTDLDFNSPAPATGATNYSIKVNTTAANTLADNLKIPKNLGPEYADRHIIPIEADLTAGGGSFTQKPAQGGPAFSVIPQYYNAGVAWAAAKDGFWTGKLNLARESGAIFKGKDGREKFLVAPYAMKQDSHISNPTVAGEKFAEVSRYISEKRINKTQQKGLSDLILNASTDGVKKASDALKVAKKEVMVAESAIKKFKGEKSEKAYKDLDADLKAKKGIASDALAKQTFFQGISKFPTSLTTKAFDSYLSPLSFDQRKWLGEKLSSAAAEKLGAPPMDQIRRATLDESFAGTDNLSLISILEIDVKKLEDGLKNKTLTAKDFGVTPHNSYNSLAPGSPVAFFRTPIPYSQAFPDIRSGLIGSGFNTNHGYFLKGKIPEGLARTQKISAQMISDWGDAQTSLRPNQAKAIVTALNQGWKTYAKPRQAGLAEFTRALRNNDAAVTLTQYSSEEVSQLLKEGKMKIYQLGDMNVWFALKRPGEGEAGDPKKDWHIVSVANNEKGAPGMLPLIMSKALAEGGTHLDCYAVKSSKYPDGLLPTLYAKSGFEATEVMPFDPQYHTEPGKMGELQKVWDSQKWNGQEKPPLVYMKWNPELHANLGTNADASDSIAEKRTAQANRRSVAGRTDTSIGRDSSEASGDMGGAGQGDQGGRVSDGSSPTGAAGNARNILPRGIEQIVADLGNLNDYQLQALGLTRTEVDEAIKNYNDPNSLNYSIASQSEIDRVNKALGGMNRGPDERLKVYHRAKNSFSRVMQENKEALDAIRSSVSTDTAPATERVEMDRAGKMADVSSEEKTELEKALQDNADTFLPRIEAAQTPAERKKVERDAKDRAKILEQGIRDKFAERKKSVDAEAKSQRDQIVQAATAKDSASNARMRDKVRNTKLVNAIGELDGILKALPPEVRGRVGGFAVLANIGTGDKALADFFVQRIDMIDRQLERTLKEEYGTQFDALLERTKPKKAKAGEKPKGIGADIQSLFSAVREARGWNPDKVDGHIANLETQIAAGNLTPEEEAWLTREADLVSLAGDWKNADSSRRAAALEAATETWAKGMYEFVQKKMQEREARDIARAEAIKATGKKGDYPDRRARSEADNGLKGKSHGWLMDTMSWDQVAGIVFGHESPIAIELSDGQRKAEYTKIDAVQAKEDAIHDLFTQLAGGSRLEGEKLMWKMSQPSIDAGGLNLSQLEALSPTMLWAQEDGRRHMIGQLDETGNPTSRWHYNQQFIDDIESQLSPEAKAVRDFLWDSYEKEWFSINSVNRELNGISLPRIFKYSPVTVNPINVPAGMVSDPVTGNAVSAGSISPGALRTRGTAIAQPNFRNVISTYIAHTRQMEHWKAFAPWTKEANGILRNSDVQDSIHEAGGEEANKVLNRFLDAFAQGGNRDASLGLEISQTLSRMTSRAAQVALVGRVGTLAIQFTQIGAASAELPMGAYVSRLGKLMTGNLSWTEALNSPYIQRRIKQMPPSVQIAMEGLKAGKPNQLKHQVTKVGQLISGSDALWTAGTYAMVYDYHLGQAKSFGFAGQAAEEYAHNTAERVTDRLAQPTRMGARSIYEITSTNPGSKLGWAFASEARKNLALLAYTKANRSAGQFGTAALGFVLFNLAMGAFIRNAWKDMKDDDDDELLDEKTWNWKRIGVAMLTEPLQGIPYLGDYIEKGINAALGQYHQSSDLISFERGVRAIKHIPDIIDGERDMEGVLKDIDGMVSLMGMFNQSAAAAASLTHIASDFFGVAKNATTED